MWVYRQSTGQMSNPLKFPTQISLGYSGRGLGRNNPDAESVPFVGPIPRGYYTIGAPECVNTSGPHGPFVLPLTPRPGFDLHGRNGFLIHGDSIPHPGTGSEGCIVLPRPIRTLIADSGDDELHVIA